MAVENVTKRLGKITTKNTESTKKNFRKAIEEEEEKEDEDDLNLQVISATRSIIQEKLLA